MAILIKYIFEAGEPVDPEVAIHLAEQFPSSIGEKVMTIAEYLRQQGMEQGMQHGIQQGMEKSAQEIAKKMFKEGIPLDTIVKITGLNEVTIKAFASEIVN